jgi:diguanylate cyclase (GGDEF)-like protein/PAS domain S-box-containing protein
MPAYSRDILHLLLLTKNQSDAEGLVSLLRNSGRATRAHMVTSLADFSENIQDKSWDLILAETGAQDVAPKELFKQLKRLDKDIPVIMLEEDVDSMMLEFYLKLGACDVVPMDESNLLSIIIERELINLGSRRSLRTAQVNLRDAEKRCQSLLENSKDAIAYIHDGMHIFANQAYLELFGYEHVDDLEGVPVMDVVADRNQDELKQSLKEFLVSGSNIDLNYNGLKTDKSEFPMIMTLSSATYADEPSTQIIIRTESNSSNLEAKLKDLRSKDLLTGLYNKPYFIDRLEFLVDRAVLKGDFGAAMYINIDRFSSLKSRVGINNSDHIIYSVASYLKSVINEEDTLARIGESTFAWVRPNINAEDALNVAEKFRSQIEQLIIDAKMQTVTVTASIGISLINESCNDPSDILRHSHQAAESALNKTGHKKGNNVHCYIATEPVEVEKEDEDLEQQIIDTLKKNAFDLLFQPSINLKGDDNEHYEVLLRMTLNNGEDISGGKFLNGFTISEDLKRKIDRWVILHATKKLSEHLQTHPKTRLFINISAASLMDTGLSAWLDVALKAANLDKSSVIFQINEQDATKFLVQAQAFTADIKAKGYLCSLSRFGCSLKPLQALNHLSLDFIKMDDSFTREIDQPETLESLKQMATELHALGFKTIIPAVESAATVAALWPLGIHFLQGYYVQTPQPSMNYSFSDDHE